MACPAAGALPPYALAKLAIYSATLLARRGQLQRRRCLPLCARPYEAGAQPRGLATPRQLCTVYLRAGRARNARHRPEPPLHAGALRDHPQLFFSPPSFLITQDTTPSHFALYSPGTILQP